MADTEKTRLTALEKERNEFFEEHRSDFEFLEGMKAKTVLNTKRIGWIAVIAVVVMIGATWGLHIALPKLSPMWMWPTIALPFLAAVTYAIVEIAKQEKYVGYYKELENGMSDVTMQLFQYDTEIEHLRAIVNSDEAEKAAEAAEEAAAAPAEAPAE